MTDDTRITAALPTIAAAASRRGAVADPRLPSRAPQGQARSEVLACARWPSGSQALLGRAGPARARTAWGRRSRGGSARSSRARSCSSRTCASTPEEEANDDGFAAALAGLAEVYVDDAFAAAHRAHASTEGIARHLQARRPRACSWRASWRRSGASSSGRSGRSGPMLGGAKVSDKLAPGRAPARAGWTASRSAAGWRSRSSRRSGHGVGRSLLEPDRLDAARAILERAREPRRPAAPAGGRGGRAGPGRGERPAHRARSARSRTISWASTSARRRSTQFAAALKGARTIIWNGPMGVFEKAPFAAGTIGVGAGRRATSGAFSVIGGGDTIAAVQQAGVTDRIGYISTAGGAFLEFLEGRVLPGVAALDEALSPDAHPARRRQLEDARHAAPRRAISRRPSATGSSVPRGVEVVVCPPFTALAAVAEVLAGAAILLGAQNCHWEAQGAFTGEISPADARGAGLPLRASSGTPSGASSSARPTRRSTARWPRPCRHGLRPVALRRRDARKSGARG